MTPKIIMLSGFKRAGKDFTANLIKEQLEAYGKSVTLLAFAAPMKRIIASTFGISLEDLERFKNEPEQFKVQMRGVDKSAEYIGDTNFRSILQKFGNEAMKPEFGSDVWAQLADTKIREAGTDYIVITDYRFDLEYDYLKKKYPDITAVYIHNVNATSDDTHSSESLPNKHPDAILDNSNQDASLNSEVTKLLAVLNVN